MKVHYINILLFALPLNILVRLYHVGSPHKKPSITPHTQTNRLLCECELYAPTNYDNDPEMKAVMQDFDRQTSERFHEYDERMKTTRQKCKDKCDEAIQKIILKDKLEKHMAQQLSTLETKITTDDIPTCVCEKSMADKVEKGCLRCAGVLGGGVMPSIGLLGGIGEGAISLLKPAALEAAIDFATKAGAAAGAAAGAQAGIKVVMDGLCRDFGLSTVRIKVLGSVINGTSYTDVPMITEAIYTTYNRSCLPSVPGAGAGPGPGGFTAAPTDQAFCSTFNALDLDQGKFLTPSSIRDFIRKGVEKIVPEAETAASTETAHVTTTQTPVLQARYTAAVEATYGGYHISIIASIVAIVVIVLIMVIIYLILRYRRKKKMKKKLQYIKLLEE
ncbi:hypothetical protein PFBG_01592 [Plasmodium falciparum 7G8]|uniref:Rifin n=1 Tax=Plasmodium falciparum (isolate 7G8) TaxID=57266 RepID=W7FQM7_PLAF8|nr:hypothetical protein PFBG_01592 [Plasmodium falciparum 7G8]